MSGLKKVNGGGPIKGEKRREEEKESGPAVAEGEGGQGLIFDNDGGKGKFPTRWGRERGFKFKTEKVASIQF